MTDEQKVWLEGFLMSPNIVRFAMIREAQSSDILQLKELADLVLTHTHKELQDMLFADIFANIRVDT